MIHFGLRLLVWGAVLGTAFLVFGPEVFDSAQRANPVGSTKPLFLPPAKSEKLQDWERQAADGVLKAGDYAAYEAEAKAWRSRFWSGNDASVEAVLSDVTDGRQAYLIDVLGQRGLAKDEIAAFVAVVARDRPDLLQDQSSQPISR